ncbi:MAG: CdaR family protein [Chloroflexota bacterium]|nr:CdaR family protein [Chloroflexota bacterium]
MEFLRRLPGALVFIGRGAISSVFGNVSLALLSVALGLSLWLFVTDRENPKVAQTFSSAVLVKFVNVPNDLAVSNASESNVRIRVEATANDLKNLRADDFQATVDLGGFPKGQVTIPVQVASSNGSVNVVETTPDRIDVTLEALRTNVVPVEVSLLGSPQQGFGLVKPSAGAPQNPSTQPASVTISGPESLIALVHSAVAEVNLTGLRADFTGDIDLRPRDVRGGDISRVKVNPGRARVTVDIEQQEFSQEFRVNPLIAGTPALGYNGVGITVDPAVISITGPLDVLQSIDAVKGISTEEISIADGRADVVRTIPVAIPPGTSVKGSPAVKVTVSIRPARGEVTFSIVPQIRNIGAGLALYPPTPVLVTLSGDLPVLQALTPESMVVTADAQALGAGIYSLPLQITPPPGTTVTRTDPGQIGIALSKRQ